MSSFTIVRIPLLPFVSFFFFFFLGEIQNYVIRCERQWSEWRGQDVKQILCEGSESRGWPDSSNICWTRRSRGDARDKEAGGSAIDRCRSCNWTQPCAIVAATKREWRSPEWYGEGAGVWREGEKGWGRSKTGLDISSSFLELKTTRVQLFNLFATNDFSATKNARKTVALTMNKWWWVK